jgi:hypothetical protein
MRDGMYSFDVTANRTVAKGIALVESDKIKWFSWSRDYEVERSKKGGKKPNGLLKSDHPIQARVQGADFFQPNLKAKRVKTWFAFKGQSDFDARKVSIQGKRLCNLPYSPASSARPESHERLFLKTLSHATFACAAPLQAQSQ